MSFDPTVCIFARLNETIRVSHSSHNITFDVSKATDNRNTRHLMLAHRHCVPYPHHRNLLACTQSRSEGKYAREKNLKSSTHQADDAHLVGSIDHRHARIVSDKHELVSVVGERTIVNLKHGSW